MHRWLIIYLCMLVCLSSSVFAQKHDTVRALYIPLADHYAAIVAYELYGDSMTYADFQLEKMDSWDLLRAKFYEERAEMAFVMAPLAVAMFQQKPYFKWIGLMHRDGNALAVNLEIAKHLNIPSNRTERKPGNEVASILQRLSLEQRSTVDIAVPHLLSTHSVVLYKYLRDYDIKLSISGTTPGAEVSTVAVPPANSPAFLRGKSNQAKPAAFEQSLPWSDLVEATELGKVVWYSKDVMQWPDGHVECVALATNKAITAKKNALHEVMHYIRKAGDYIEWARSSNSDSLDQVIAHIRKHIPEHTEEAIRASLRKDLHVINYKNLTIDKEGMKQVIDLAVEAGILGDTLDLDAFSDDSFDRTFQEGYNE